MLAELKKGAQLHWRMWLLSMAPTWCWVGNSFSTEECTRLTRMGGGIRPGNTLGTVLAHAVLRILAQRGNGSTLNGHVRITSFYFCASWTIIIIRPSSRTICMLEDLPSFNLLPTMERLPPIMRGTMWKNMLRRRLLLAASELERLFVNSGVVKSVKVDHIHLPWKRLFEVGFDVHVELFNQSVSA